MMTTQKQIREAFWVSASRRAGDRKPSKTQNDYNATIRSEFVAFVDSLARDNQISGSLAKRVTL